MPAKPEGVQMRRHTPERLDEALASGEQLARRIIAASNQALELPQNTAITEEIDSTKKTALGLCAYAEAGQCAPANAEKRRALAKVICLTRQLDRHTKWMAFPVERIAFAQRNLTKQ